MSVSTKGIPAITQTDRMVCIYDKRRAFPARAMLRPMHPGGILGTCGVFFELVWARLPDMESLEHGMAKVNGRDWDEIRRGWTPVRIGWEILQVDETDSTNSQLLEMADRPDADGLVLLADYQTAGRGRQGRRWLSPRGASILCSVLVAFSDAPGGAPAGDAASGEPAIAGRLNMLAAVAACEAIAASTEVRAAIKWPNDLRISGRKLGGILIESRPRAAGGRVWVLGFGINCLQHVGHFPTEIAAQATSLELAASHPIDRAAVTLQLLMRLDERLSSPGWLRGTELYEAWLSLAEPIGQRVELKYQGLGYSGRTIAVDPLGGLTLQLDNGRQMWFDPLLTSVV